MLAWEPRACNEAEFRSSSAICCVRKDSERTKKRISREGCPLRTTRLLDRPRGYLDGVVREVSRRRVVAHIPRLYA